MISAQKIQGKYWRVLTVGGCQLYTLLTAGQWVISWRGIRAIHLHVYHSLLTVLQWSTSLCRFGKKLLYDSCQNLFLRRKLEVRIKGKTQRPNYSSGLRATIGTTFPSFTINFKFSPPSDPPFASHSDLSGKVNQTLIPEMLKALVAMPLSGWKCCTCLFTVIIRQCHESAKWVSQAPYVFFVFFPVLTVKQQPYHLLIIRFN